MEPQQTAVENVLAPLKVVTPVSKYLTLALFITLPFIGGYIGYVYAPEKVVEIERVVVQEVGAREDLFEMHDFSRDTLTLIEAPELHNAEAATGWSTSYHIFYDDRHVISVPGDCRMQPPESAGFRAGFELEERNEYEVLSHVVCNQSSTWFGAETLLLGKIDPPAGPVRKVIHYNFRDCGMSGNDCEPYGPPIILFSIAHSN